MAGGRRVPGLHRTFSENACINARWCTKKVSSLLEQGEMHRQLLRPSSLQTLKFLAGTVKTSMQTATGKKLLEPMNQMLGTLGRLVKYWDPGKLENTEEHGTMEERKCTILQMDGVAISFINVPSSNCMFIAVRTTCFKAFVCSEVGTLHDCCSSEISHDSKHLFP